MNSFKDHVVKMLKSGVRLDGRKLTDYRKVSVEYGITSTAEGSARVKIGDTEVVVGIKMEVGKPYPDIPNEGTIIVGAELLPMSNPEFESGPPGIQAIELARIVDRGIRESKTIDFKKLCIEEGEKVWLLLIDVIPINDSGNLLDASSLAALAALKDAYYPKLEGDKINYEEKTKNKVALRDEPIAITVLKIGDSFIVDPDTEEEKLVDARLTVASQKDGQLCAMQKGGDTALMPDEIEKMIDIGLEKAKLLRGFL